MLVVSNTVVSETLKYLSAYSGKICLAAFNSPQSCTLSGDADAIESLHDKLKTLFDSKNVFLHILDVPAAYHSHMMDPILSNLETSIGTLQGNEMETQLFSTVTGKVCSQMDFLTGTYWARNIREPVAFEEAVKSAAKERKNIVFVEIGPRRALQRNIIETLGNDIIVLTSVQPDKDHDTMLTLVTRLFEMGVDVNWDQFYAGYEAPPTTFPVYQFDCPKKKVFFEAIRSGNNIPQSHHPLISWVAREEVCCNFSLYSESYIQEHKHNGSVIVPGAVHVELALASFMAIVKQNVPLCFLQLGISFQNLLVLVKNSPEVKVKLEPEENETKFKIHSSIATYASGTIHFKSSPTVVAEKNIMLDSVFKRCNSILTEEQIYTVLSHAGFEYGPTLRLLRNVHYGEELMEAVSIVKPLQAMTCQLHNYCIHPVLLDCFLQMTAVITAGRHTSRPAFPASIGCVTVTRPLQEEMVMYLRMTLKGSHYFEVCGCFTDKEGQVLVELQSVRIKLLAEPSYVTEKCFFHNECHIISKEINSTHRPKALVFEDPMGVAKAFQDCLHPKSTFVSYTNSRKQLVLPISGTLCSFDLADGILDFEEVLFMWGIQDLSSLDTEMILEKLTDCCEFYRQVLLYLKKGQCSLMVRVITYKVGGKSVDHISPGFVLSGMTRSCAAEITDLSFQLINVDSLSCEDIRALAHVISSYESRKFPEIFISNGQIYSTAITRTNFKTAGKDSVEGRTTDLGSEPFILQTADPYRMKNLCAIPSVSLGEHVREKTVEVQLDRVCVHSSEYSPVSVSDLNFHQTIYWEKQTFQNHTLLALDFSGTVTAVGKGVRKLRVGDHVASCYPVTASSKIIIPEGACYRTKRFPFLKEVPCISYFVLSWEIFHNMLPKGNQVRRIGILSSNPDSVLVQILVQTANKSGWIATAGTEVGGLIQNVKTCDAFIFLPQFNPTLVAEACHASTVKYIVLVGNRQEPLPSSTFRNDNENVYLQNVQVTNILQKVNLKKQQDKIYKWLKSTFLNQESLNMQYVTFQRTPGAPDDSELECYESYFSLKTIAVVVLDSGTKDPGSDIQMLIKPKPLFKKKSVYVVTGGLSGLGLETVKFIAQRGGGCIAVLSRRALSTEMQLEMNILQSQCGVSVISLQCDVSVSEQVLGAFSLIAQRFPFCPIRGVFHSAVVLQDGLIETLDRLAFEKVLRPKVNGVLNLHYATVNYELDYFVCYSSISSFIGNASQNTGIQKPMSPYSLEEYVKSLFSETCNIDLNELSGDTTLSVLGVDSMLAMTLQNMIFQERGVNIPLVKLLDPNTTLSALLSIMNEHTQGNF
ncbi:hypothetical protein Z043_121149 [Scleropages formosus]|uniref:Uncharacterized protein n=1 Tax=Scleropages formosus TaxID=113540 RepID=A0A0N8JWF8_SCLFO|nr:hypothetical protein Z043_121149 [Scleropages formosus]